jgi:hypothetical protein
VDEYRENGGERRSPVAGTRRSTRVRAAVKVVVDDHESEDQEREEAKDEMVAGELNNSTIDDALLLLGVAKEA